MKKKGCAVGWNGRSPEHKRKKENTPHNQRKTQQNSTNATRQDQNTQRIQQQQRAKEDQGTAGKGKKEPEKRRVSGCPLSLRPSKSRKVNRIGCFTGDKVAFCPFFYMVFSGLFLAGFLMIV